MKPMITFYSMYLSNTLIENTLFLLIFHLPNTLFFTNILKRDDFVYFDLIFCFLNSNLNTNILNSTIFF